MEDRLPDFGNMKQRINSLKTKEGLKQNWPLFLVPAVFLIAVYIRYMPAKSMEHLQALDTYWHLRHSQHFAFDLTTPATDFMQYFPYNAPMYNFYSFNMVFPALMYWLGPFAIFSSYVQWAQFYPVFMGGLTVVITYFLGKEMFNRLTGISSAFFMAIIPGILQRTSAGFFEKEPTAAVFMLCSIYFFTRSWKRKEHIAGVLSGLFLGTMTLTWGGSKMLWLLYPLVVGLMLWINEDIEKLVMAYTPTFLIGAGLGSIFLPSRFWITDEIFLINLMMFGILWSRYLVEELHLIKENHLGYYVPSVSILGGIALLLSPIYSSFIAKKVLSLLGTLQAQSSTVIGGTVAENQGAGLGQLVGQLGAAPAARFGILVDAVPAAVGTIFNIIGNINGAWPLAFIAVTFIGTNLVAMILRKADLIGKQIKEINYLKILLGVTTVWVAVFSSLFNSSAIIAVGPALISIIGGVAILYSLDELKEELEIEFNWYYLLPLVWLISNVLTAVNTSRVIFLAAFPIAFCAGLTLSKVVNRINQFEQESIKHISISSIVILTDIILIALLGPVIGLPISAAIILAINGVAYLYFPEEWVPKRELVSGRSLKTCIITSILALTILVNFAAGYSTANGLTGDPNNLWKENLDYVSEKTDEGSVVLSWWDYGYWIQTIGERPSVADGGNNNYYTTEGNHMNKPLAKYLTGTNSGNHTKFLEKHSVDYILLDETMIGKYSAVSQIANQDSENFNSMIQISTSNNIRQSLDSEAGLVEASQGRITVFANIKQTNQSISLKKSEASLLEIESRRGVRRTEIGCTVTDDGIVEHENISETAKLNSFGEVCIAENPYYSLSRSFFSAQTPQLPAQSAKLVLIPREILNTNLVRLYLMDGKGIDYVEKDEQGSNDFIKMWKVKDSKDD